MVKDVLDAVRLALTLEREEVDYYRLASDKTVNPNGKKVFEYLADEEEKHIEALKNLINSVESKDSWLSDEELFDKKACRTLRKKRPAGIIPDKVKSDAGDLEALRQAISIEKKSIEFYTDAACNVKNKGAAQMFHFLIEAEKEHLKELEMQHAFLEGEGIWYDNEMILS